MFCLMIVLTGCWYWRRGSSSQVFFYKKLDIYIFMFFFSSYIKEVFFFSILSLSIQYY
jgi:hypothetical protein